MQTPPSTTMTLYDELDKSTNQIRVLELLPAQDKKEQLQCIFRKVSLDDQTPAYVALSYVWGDPTASREIIVNGETVLVTQNLFEILHFMRHSKVLYKDDQDPTKDTRLPLWIDAICINQTNIPERNDQVSKMIHIYQSAYKTVAWTSDALLLQKSILRFRQQIKHMLHGQSAREISDAVEIWSFHPLSIFNAVQALRDIQLLTAETYWSRAWITQELICSPIVQFIFTEERMYRRMDGPYFTEKNPEKARSLLESLTLEKLSDCWTFVSRLCKGHYPYGIPRTMLSKLSDHVISIQSSPLSFILDERARRHGDMRPHLSKCMGQLLDTKATDPRDKIFAFGGITRIGIDIDYSLSCSTVYQQFASGCIENGATDVLLYAGELDTEKDEIDLPSWVPNWFSLKGPDTSHSDQTKRVEFCQGWDELAYHSANRGLQMDGPLSVEDGRIAGQGCFVDSIAWCEKKVVTVTNDIKWTADYDDMLSLFYWLLEGYYGKERYSCFERIIRVIFLHHRPVFLHKKLQLHVHYRNRTAKEFARVIWSYFHSIASDKEKWPEIDGIQLEQWNEAEEEHISEPANLCLRRLQINHVLGTATGRLVISPACAQQDDLICILPNCGFPVILRRVDEGRFSYIGACYAEGLMDGEAAGLIADGCGIKMRLEII